MPRDKKIAHLDAFEMIKKANLTCFKMNYQVLDTCWSSRTRPQCQRGHPWKGMAPIKVLWNTDATLQNPSRTQRSLSTWKLKKRRAGSFLSPYWPASSLSSILTFQYKLTFLIHVDTYWCSSINTNQRQSPPKRCHPLHSRQLSSPGSSPSEILDLWDFIQYRHYWMSWYIWDIIVEQSQLIPPCLSSCWRRGPRCGRTC